MKKIGFHYLPDTEHYRAADLECWLPRLQQLGASFTVLQAPVERAIPEAFLHGLMEADIEPVLHFQIAPDRSPGLDDLALLFETYARWGVKYVILFDRPNSRTVWQSSNWSRSNLVERFLDGFLPLAEAAVAVGLVPIFPPLEPGGDYWDTTFLRDALEGLLRRASEPLLNRLLLSALAEFRQKPLNWGAGGPERWPAAQPYLTPETSEDQRGFRIADWYLTLSETVLERRLPIILLGIKADNVNQEDQVDQLLRSRDLFEGAEIPDLEPLPAEVIGGAFYVLSAGNESRAVPYQWIRSDGVENLAAVRYFEQEAIPVKKEADSFRFKHYLLLPSFEWGISDWHLDVTRAFIKKHQPTVGFSLQEACRADRVTVLGGEDYFRDQDISQLRQSGCQVRQIVGDGTKIASQLAAI